LHLSQKTVDSHRTHLKEKLNLRQASELIRFAFEWVGALEA
jgi:DNA-binding NarL/FixJ family response regulator